MQYIVQNQRVEIGGITREIGEVLEDTVFAPAPTPVEGEPYVLGEIESLLSTGHIRENI